MDDTYGYDTDPSTEESPLTLVPTPGTSLVPALRSSLDAKLHRLLSRPIVARLGAQEPHSGEAECGDDGDCEADDMPLDFLAMLAASRETSPRRSSERAPLWHEDPRDGTTIVPIRLDYLDQWRGNEKEVLETVKSTVEESVTFLTDAHRRLLLQSPAEFLELQPAPEAIELVGYQVERVGGVERVVALIVADPPKAPRDLVSVAIVPNLIPLQRQLAALRALEEADDDGPLAPLRNLVGLGGAACLAWPPRSATPATLTKGARLDPYQAACVQRALATPHFALFEGPPGSGKTTVITELIRQATERGERVLVVSPTHTAVDNVVEKLGRKRGDTGPDTLAPVSIPVRYAAKRGKVSPAALPYWVGKRTQQRAGTIASRVEQVLVDALPEARDLFKRVDPQLGSVAPLTTAIVTVEAVICGTPLGVLSHTAVRDATPGSFDLLVVDEVSKMTLPEFLAIAVKAKRWVLVGDPQQLPPYNNSVDNATTLDELHPPALELCCSVGALVERTHPAERHDMRVVVVATDPAEASRAAAAHLTAVDLGRTAAVALFPAAPRAGFLFCTQDELDAALHTLTPARDRDRSHSPDQRGSVQVLVERGLNPPRPGFASGWRFVEPRQRAQAVLFETSFDVYHCQPWALRAHHKLRSVAFRNGLNKLLPSQAAIDALDLTWDGADAAVGRAELLDLLAERFAVNAVSVYDWLAGMPTDSFDVSPLVELGRLREATGPLLAAVAPYCSTLCQQYRMHPTLSAVPRALFYFGEALQDGAPPKAGGNRALLVQVDARGPGGEDNPAEADEIDRLIGLLPAGGDGSVMIITPYRAQERLIRERLEGRLQPGREVEVCTLDRCQGREADYVFVSLVRGRATPFMDAPKRWNVALTRAREGLFLVGDVDSYLAEAQRARREAPHHDRGGDGSRGPRPQMSLLARVIEAYDLQGRRSANPRS
jgi:DNA polymerase III delta prime subunit